MVPRQRRFENAQRRAKRLRRTATPAERAAWRTLRRLPDTHFRRQAPLGRFVFDFVDHGAKLIVEVDGGVHRLANVAARDATKERFAAEQGYVVVRVDNAEARSPEALLAKVEAAAAAPHPSIPSPQGGGED